MRDSLVNSASDWSPVQFLFITNVIPPSKQRARFTPRNDYATIVGSHSSSTILPFRYAYTPSRAPSISPRRQLQHCIQPRLLPWRLVIKASIVNSLFSTCSRPLFLCIITRTHTFDSPPVLLFSAVYIPRFCWLESPPPFRPVSFNLGSKIASVSGIHTLLALSLQVTGRVLDLRRPPFPLTAPPLTIR